VTPSKFRRNLWHQKTRIFGLSCGVDCTILRSAVLVQHRLVTDEQINASQHCLMSPTPYIISICVVKGRHLYIYGINILYYILNTRPRNSSYGLQRTIIIRVSLTKLSAATAVRTSDTLTYTRLTIQLTHELDRIIARSLGIIAINNWSPTRRPIIASN